MAMTTAPAAPPPTACPRTWPISQDRLDLLGLKVDDVLIADSEER